ESQGGSGSPPRVPEEWSRGPLQTGELLPPQRLAGPMAPPVAKQEELGRLDSLYSGDMTRRSPRLTLVADGKDGQSAPPAFVIDAAAGAIIAANAAGREAWGLCLGDSCAPVAIDRAMPALQQLAPLSRSGAGAMLTFWAATGLLRLHCRVEPAGRGD